MTVTINKEITTKIDEIISRRHKDLRDIDRCIDEISEKYKWLNSLLDSINNFIKNENDESVLSEIKILLDALEDYLDKLNSRKMMLTELKEEFSRNTLNIGVSGEARSGKSLTLQKMSGLDNKQIPTGKGLPVTAVRSVIYNDSQDCATVKFRSENDFIQNYIKSHLDNINEFLEEPISISTLSQLKSYKFPDSIESASNAASYSLQKLVQAQNGVDSYSSYLTGQTQTIKLDELSQFVSYPNDEEEELEKNKGKLANRAYLAVENIDIHCKFPELGKAKIALVDLPGLGEVGKSVAKTHLAGLESKVDQIFLIMKSTTTSGFVGKAISDNLENLNTIQPGVKYRSDLITAGVNVEKGMEKTSESLQHSFERDINDSRPEYDKYQLISYDASNMNEVSSVLQDLLAKLAEKLPQMDSQKLKYVMDGNDLDSEISQLLENLTVCLSQVQKRIPKPENIMYKKVKDVSSSIIQQYNTLEYNFLQSKYDNSDLYEKFQNDVKTICNDVDGNIKDCLFMNSYDEWEVHSMGQTDYLNFYRDEAKRIKREITDAYNQLDEFYLNSMDEFKITLIDAFLNKTGNIRSLFNFSKTDSPDDMLDKIIYEFDGSIAGFESILVAFEFLRKVSFSFRSHVILQIDKHLEELTNPLDDKSAGIKVASKAIVLGDIGTETQVKIKKVHSYLVKEASKANNDIAQALLENNDSFNQVLSNTLTFFIDDMYRKNEDYFSNVVVRSLILKYKNCFFEKDELNEDPREQAIEDLKDLIASYKNGFYNVSTNTNGKISSSMPEVATKYMPKKQTSHQEVKYQTKKVNLTPYQKKIFDKLNVGDKINGTVVRIIHAGAIIQIDRGVCGLLNVQNMSYTANVYDNPNDYVSANDKILVKVLTKDNINNRLCFCKVEDLKG